MNFPGLLGVSSASLPAHSSQSVVVFRFALFRRRSNSSTSDRESTYARRAVISSKYVTGVTAPCNGDRAVDVPRFVKMKRRRSYFF